MSNTVSIYSTPELLAEKIDEYFEHCNIRVGRATVNTPTMAGLARYLGFKSRSQLLNYKNDANPLFEDVIAEARLRVEEYLEGQLVHSKSPAGIIFSLKNNAQWVDKVETVIDKKDEPKRAVAWVEDPIPITAVNPTPLPMGEAKKEGTVDDDND